MRVALVHDWLVSMRGGERVLEAFCELFPEAVVHTLFHAPGSCSPAIERMDIRTSFLDRLPLARAHHRHLLPLYPHAIEGFDFRGFDLVLSSSSCAAKGVVTPAGVPHVCYCHTPVRYLWDMFPDYFGAGRAGPLTRLAARSVAPFLRLWDESSSARVDRFIANSDNVARRIAKRYRRSAAVIAPPVSLDRFAPLPADQVGDFFLMVTALVPYKRADLAVEAFVRSGRRLKIVGRGPERARLERMARGASNVEFVEGVADEAIADLYAHCRALIFPGEEDAGITPLEAQASGRPVIAFGRGGALETVLGLDGEGAWAPDSPGATGVFFPEQTVASLEAAIERLEMNFGRFDPTAARVQAEKFGVESFKARIRQEIESALGVPELADFASARRAEAGTKVS